VSSLIRLQRLTSSMPMHPLPILLNHGVPVALCSDDPSVFGNMGLSFDHFQVIAASEVTGLLQLAAISRGSFGVRLFWLYSTRSVAKMCSTSIPCWMQTTKCLQRRHGKGGGRNLYSRLSRTVTRFEKYFREY